MTTISTNLYINRNGIRQSRSTTELPRNQKYHSNYDQISKDINQNASTVSAEYQRDACEEELYKLRYGIERLLADTGRGGFKTQPRSSFRRVLNKVSNFSGLSWFDRCSPCCRSRRRNIYSPNQYTPNRVYNDEKYNSPSQTTPTPTPLYSDSIASTPSAYSDPDLTDTKRSLRKSIDSLINPTKPGSANISELSASFDVNDPAYNSLVLKVLEAKALDCLCTGYSSKNTQKQVTKALNELNHRTDEHQSDSESVISSPSSSATSVQSELISPSSPNVQTPDTNESISPQISPETKSSLRAGGKDKSSRKKSNVKIVGGKSSKRSKSKTKRKSSARNRKRAKTPSTRRSKSGRPSKRRSRSKRSTKGRTKSSRRAKGRSASKTPTKRSTKSRRSSSKQRQQKGSARSRSKTKRVGKSKKRAKSKRRKPKSNNQVDDRQIFLPSTCAHPQSYQDMYRNRQKLFQILLPTV